MLLEEAGQSTRVFMVMKDRVARFYIRFIYVFSMVFGQQWSSVSVLGDVGSVSVFV